MKAVLDRSVQFPNRYTLRNVDTSEVLGTFDFTPVPGEVLEEGTPINRALFQSIADDLNKMQGPAGTITVERVDTLLPSQSASVRNVGSPEQARLVFGIPQGKSGLGIKQIEFKRVGTSLAGGYTYQVDITYDDGTTAQSDIIETPKGQDGISITVESTTTEYAQSDNGVNIPSSWQPSIPTPIPQGKYLWVRQKIVFSDKQEVSLYAVAYQGVNGVNGTNGVDGSSITVQSTQTTYATSVSGTVTPVGEWSSNIPHVEQGQFLWTKTVTTFSDGKSATMYSVSRQGVDGEGIKGDKGDSITGVNVVLDSQDDFSISYRVEVTIEEQVEPINAGIIKIPLSRKMFVHNVRMFYQTSGSYVEIYFSIITDEPEKYQNLGEIANLLNSYSGNKYISATGKILSTAVEPDFVIGLTGNYDGDALIVVVAQNGDRVASHSGNNIYNVDTYRSLFEITDWVQELSQVYAKDSGGGGGGSGVNTLPQIIWGTFDVEKSDTNGNISSAKLTVCVSYPENVDLSYLDNFRIALRKISHGGRGLRNCTEWHCGDLSTYDNKREFPERHQIYYEWNDMNLKRIDFFFGNTSRYTYMSSKSTRNEGYVGVDGRQIILALGMLKTGTGSNNGEPEKTCEYYCTKYLKRTYGNKSKLQENYHT